MLLAEKIGTRLTIGWVGGAVISFIGVKLSWHTGLPTSPLVVCMLAVTLVLAGVIRYVRLATNRKRAVINLAASTLVFGLFLAGVLFFAKREESPFDHTLHMLQSKLATDRTVAIGKISTFAERKNEWLPLLLQRLSDEDAEVRKASVMKVAELGEKTAVPQLTRLLHDPSNEVRHEALKALRLLGDRSVTPDLSAAASQEEDPEMKIDLLATALELGEAKAIPLFIEIIEAGGLFGNDAFDQLQKHLEPGFKSNEVGKLKKWWQENQHRIEFNVATKQFGAR
ncbi:MAG: HEAT repeat domain-containing protein [Bacteroidota bacterium]